MSERHAEHRTLSLRTPRDETHGSTMPWLSRTPPRAPPPGSRAEGSAAFARAADPAAACTERALSMLFVYLIGWQAIFWTCASVRASEPGRVCARGRDRRGRAREGVACDRRGRVQVKGCERRENE